MLATIRSLGVKGIGGYGVSVEVFVSNGLVNFDIVGLPDAAVREARERVRAAIKSNGFKFPVSRVTVNLAPADTKKAGTVYDLPIMLGILAATGVIRQPKSDCAFFGELSLNGTLRPVSGALPMAVAAAREGVRELFVPADNAQEASYAEGVTVYPVENVSELIAHLRGEFRIKPMDIPKLDAATVIYPAFSDVKGQENVKRAMEIAAAGGHNILMVGPPGAGKSMMSKRLPGILPDMTREEMLKSTEIYSVAGLTGKNNPIISARPFRALQCPAAERFRARARSALHTTACCFSMSCRSFARTCSRCCVSRLRTARSPYRALPGPRPFRQTSCSCAQ